MEFIFSFSHLISHSFAALTRSISIWTLEDKFHISARPCIILYLYFWLLQNKFWDNTHIYAIRLTLLQLLLHYSFYYYYFYIFLLFQFFHVSVLLQSLQLSFKLMILTGEYTEYGVDTYFWLETFVTTLCREPKVALAPTEDSDKGQV